MRSFFLIAGLAVFAIGIKADSLESILARMDAASPGFHGATADLTMLTFTAILSDQTVEKGTLQMQRLKNGDTRAIIAFPGTSDARTIAFFGHTVRIYYPNTKAYQDYDVGKNASVMNQYLLLGFGSSGKQLEQSYNISLGASENVAGKDTTKLVLVPKDTKVLEHLTRAELWIPADGPNPLQQQFYEPTGNYRRVTYSNMTLNPPIQGTLELKLPSDARRQQ
jgi:outer membrane lipoprotein-sorting protein